MRRWMLLALLASPIAAQSSENYGTTGGAFVGAGGATSEDGGTYGYLSVPGIGGGTGSSENFDGAAGFLEANETAPPDLPLVYGVDVGHGPVEGGTALVISGVNFDLFGSGPSVTVDVGGVPCTSVVVVSNTQVTCTTAAGSMGAQDVLVSSNLGSDTIEGGFVYTPALVTESVATLGGGVEFSNYGPPGGLFFVRWSVFATSIPLPGIGTLEIGPVPIFGLYSNVLYPPGGVDVRSLAMPSDPTLSGATLYFQTLAVTSFAPITLLLTNSTAVAIQ